MKFNELSETKKQKGNSRGFIKIITVLRDIKGE